jgi:hypothetical protein
MAGNTAGAMGPAPVAREPGSGGCMHVVTTLTDQVCSVIETAPDARASDSGARFPGASPAWCGSVLRGWNPASGNRRGAGSTPSRPTSSPGSSRLRTAIEIPAAGHRDRRQTQTAGRFTASGKTDGEVCP